MTLLTYLISIPLGIRKAVRDGEPFDTWTSAVLVIGYAIPGFLFAVLLLILFAGSSFFQWFPSRGLFSDNWDQLSLFGKITDYLWHLVLPMIAMAVGSFTAMTFLTKNSFLDEIRKQYVVAARAKGLTENQVLYGHVFRNAMLLVISGFPAAFISAFFSGALLIETIFSLDGLGLLSFEASRSATIRSCSRLSTSSRWSACSSASCPTSSTPSSIRASTSRRVRSEAMDQRTDNRANDGNRDAGQSNVVRKNQSVSASACLPSIAAASNASRRTSSAIARS